MSSFVGIDVGSSGCKVTVIDEAGVVLAHASEATATEHPAPGWVEQDPHEWLRAARTAFGAALAALTPPQRSGVRAIGFSGPTHVAVLIGADGRPVRNAIMWNDQRSGDQARRLEREHGDALRALSRNTVSPTWTIAHLCWLNEHEPEVLTRTSRITFLKDWVREQFTAGPLDAVTDVVDAQGTMLVDVATSTWSPLTLGLCGITADLLPRIVEPLHRAGEIDPGAAQAVGLPHTVNIVTGSTDTATELLAAGITESGTTAVKLATAGNVARVTETLPEPSRDIVYSYLFPGTYYLNTATSSAAASMRWVSRILGAAGHLDYADLDELSESTRPGAEGLVFTPYLNGERSPHWDPDLRGSLVGLTDRTQPRHIARAVMEGVAFSLKDAADVVGVSLTGTLVLIGGGARSRVWPQIIADVLGAAVVCAPECDSSAGAALLAARQHGHPIALRSATVQTRVDPSRSAAEVYARLFPVYRAVAAATREPAHALKDISTS